MEDQQKPKVVITTPEVEIETPEVVIKVPWVGTKTSEVGTKISEAVTPSFKMVIATKDETNLIKGNSYEVVRWTYGMPWVIDEKGVTSFLLRKNFKNKTNEPNR